LLRQSGFDVAETSGTMQALEKLRGGSIHQGKVIGVNFAIPNGFGGSNFGIPILYAEALLK